MHIRPDHPHALAAQLRSDSKPQRQAVQGETDKQALQGAQAEEQNTGDEANLPGVIRKLQEGHFKGVADVRLRIVHADRIAALQQGRTVTAIRENAGTLTTALAPIVADFETAALDAASAAEESAESETLAAFEAEVANAVAELGNDGGITVEGFRAAVETAFTTLVEQLGLTEAAEITAAFETALDELLSSASESILPSISEPSGNGAAFGKFMAIYESMQINAAEPATGDKEASSSELDLEV